MRQRGMTVGATPPLLIPHRRAKFLPRAIRCRRRPNYHEERPHQGLGNELVAPKTTMIGPGQITCRERLGGVLKFCYREAA
jgi:hypothetical protein